MQARRGSWAISGDIQGAYATVVADHQAQADQRRPSSILGRMMVESEHEEESDEEEEFDVDE